MALTNQEKVVLRILLQKELENVKKQGKRIFIDNSPFLNKIEGDSDLPFLKSEKLYEQYLQELLKTL